VTSGARRVRFFDRYGVDPVPTFCDEDVV